MTISAANLKSIASGPEAFRRELIIPGGRGPVRFADALADFQRRDFAALDPAFLALRDGRQPTIGRFWIERTKGASKDTDLATLILWLLAFTPRMLTCQVGASDQDQADELRKAALGIVKLNPWLAETLDVQTDRIINTRTVSECVIIPADLAGSHGARPDLLLLNELTHLPDGKKEFAENLLDNASKVPHGVVIIATNAGYTPSWQWLWRENARLSKRWYFSAHTEAAPWLEEAEIEEAKKRNPPSRFARLWKGVWVAGGGDAIPENLIDAALTQEGPMESWQPGWIFLGGLDLGLSRDASALAVVGVNVGWVEEIPEEEAPRPRLVRALEELGYYDATEGRSSVITHSPTGRIRLASLRVWRPTAGLRVRLEDVELATIEAHRRFGLSAVGYDPWQAAYLGERLQKAGIPAYPIDPTAPNLKAQASAVLEAFSEKRIDLYPDDDLVGDLRGLRIVEKSYGVRLESPRGPAGHGDTASALALSLLLGKNVGPHRNRIEGPLTCYP